MDRANVPIKEFLREIAKKPLLSVKKLSLFQYNGDPLDEDDPSNVKFSQLKDADIEKISTCFPNL